MSSVDGLTLDSSQVSLVLRLNQGEVLPRGTPGRATGRAGRGEAGLQTGSSPPLPPGCGRPCGTHSPGPGSLHRRAILVQTPNVASVCASPDVPWRATQGRRATTGAGIKQTGLKSCLHYLPGGGEGTSLCPHRKNRETTFPVGFWVRINCSNVTVLSTWQKRNKSTAMNNSDCNFYNYKY